MTLRGTSLSRGRAQEGVNGAGVDHEVDVGLLVQCGIDPGRVAAEVTAANHGVVHFTSLPCGGGRAALGVHGVGLFFLWST